MPAATITWRLLHCMLWATAMSQAQEQGMSNPGALQEPYLRAGPVLAKLMQHLPFAGLAGLHCYQYIYGVDFPIWVVIIIAMYIIFFVRLFSYLVMSAAYDVSPNSSFRSRALDFRWVTKRNIAYQVVWSIVEPAFMISVPFLLPYGQMVKKPGILASFALCCRWYLDGSSYTDIGLRERKAFADSEQATIGEGSQIESGERTVDYRSIGNDAADD